MGTLLWTSVSCKDSALDEAKNLKGLGHQGSFKVQGKTEGFYSIQPLDFTSLDLNLQFLKLRKISCLCLPAYVLASHST